MIQDKYTLSFNTRAALILDTITIARLYTEIGNWNDVRDTVLEHNTLQARTISTLKRIYSEISNRLKTLSDDEIDLLVKGTGHEREKEQKQIVWLGICKRYLLIRDFTIEVLSHYYDKAQYSLSQDDYDAFYNSSGRSLYIIISNLQKKVIIRKKQFDFFRAKYDIFHAVGVCLLLITQ